MKTATVSPQALKVHPNSPVEVVSPTGRPIQGTLERASACRPVTFSVGTDGNLTYRHDGREPHIFTEQLRTVRRLGQPLFLDDQGSEWLLNQLVVRQTGRQAAG